jgi:DNA-directed RNA polymerase subunit RPC12/RpoP
MSTVPPPLPGQPVAPPPLPPQAAPPPPAPPEPTNAFFQTTEQTRTYPCSNCGAQLEFSIQHQKLACHNCGYIQELVEGQTRTVEERDFRDTIRELRMSKESQQQLVQGEKEVVCQNCGGHLTFTGTLTSTRCPYCATPIQRDDIHDAPARLPVDGVLPFQVDERKANEQLQKWISSRWFAPSEFKKYSSKGSFASVYAAYFSYDAEATTSYRGERGENYTVTVGSGDNKRTETRTRWYHVSGRVENSFDDLTVLANDNLDRDRITKLEPWPTEQVRPFSPEFIQGHIARTYDQDVEECFPEAEQRMASQIDSTIRSDIGGDQQRIHSKKTDYGRLTFKHLLLPIWLLTVIYQGQPFQVYMNGVTGEVHGERPYSKAKIAIAVILAIIVIAIGFFLYSSS